MSPTSVFKTISVRVWAMSLAISFSLIYQRKVAVQRFGSCSTHGHRKKYAQIFVVIDTFTRSKDAGLTRTKYAGLTRTRYAGFTRSRCGHRKKKTLKIFLTDLSLIFSLQGRGRSWASVRSFHRQRMHTRCDAHTIFIMFLEIRVIFFKGLRHTKKCADSNHATLMFTTCVVSEIQPPPR